jgi:hypothetical protein
MPPPSRLFFLKDVGSGPRQEEPARGGEGGDAGDEPLPWQVEHKDPRQRVGDAGRQRPVRARQAPGAWYAGGVFSWERRSGVPLR